MTNDDTIRDAAIGAAAKWHTGVEHDSEVWADRYRAEVYARVTPLVDAVLAVVGPAYRAAALANARRLIEGEISECNDVLTADSADVSAKVARFAFTLALGYLDESDGPDPANAEGADHA